MSYPPQVILRRLPNELKMCSKYLGNDFSFDPSSATLPLTIDMTMTNVFGYESRDKPITTHRFSVIITEDFGQRKPEIRWRSHIFHPNIMDPDDGGLVCLKTLNDWTYGTHLVDFLASIEMMVANPNPRNPFGTKSCLEAAQYYLDNETKFKASVH